jgi:hypothetical protein
MPEFTTPEPIDLAVDIPYGRLDIIAADRTDTIVTVSPTSGSAADRRGAENTRVEFDGHRVVVAVPRHFSIIGPSESVDLRVELPAGSRVTAEVGGSVRATGRLGATRIKGSLGAVEVDETADLWVRAGHGSLIVGSAGGSAELTADHGLIRVGSIAGDAIVKASHGAIEIGETRGDIEAKLSYGDLEIGSAQGSVTAKTAYGTIRLGEISGGSIRLDSGYGQIGVGVRPGVAVWLDAASRDGRVRNELEPQAAPGDAADTVAVRARTTYGDITIHRTTKGSTR